MGERHKAPVNEATSNEGQPQLVDVQAALRALVHELRSPLQSILSSVDVLDATELPAGPRRAVDRLQRSALALETHLGDLAMLLLIQSGDSGDHGDSRVRGDVFEVSDLLREVEALAARMGLALKVENGPASIVAVADAHLLRRMLLRLVLAFAKLPDAGALSITTRGTLHGVSILRLQVRCAHVVVWPEGFEDRLLPVQAMAGAVRGRLDLVDGAAILTIPARIEDGEGQKRAES